MALATGTLIDSVWPQQAGGSLLRPALLAVAGSVLLAVSAQVQIPVQPVPFTLQTMALLLIGAVYGPWLGAATVLLYLAEAAVGLPVLQGFATMWHPKTIYTAGFLAGFPIAAFIAGWFTQSSNARGLIPAVLIALVAFLVADAVVFALGYGWLASLIGSDAAWTAGVAPFLLWDAVKVALAAVVTAGAWRTVSNDGSSQS